MSRFRKVRLQNTPPGNKSYLFKRPGMLKNYFTQEKTYVKYTKIYLENW